MTLMLRPSVRYEAFQDAQQAAVEVTDRYCAIPVGDPRKEALWQEVVSRTEESHNLLKAWLAEEEAEESLAAPH